MEDKDITLQPNHTADENYIDINPNIGANFDVSKLEKKFTSKGYSTGELIVFYQCSYKTWRAWINPHRERIGKRSGHSYTIPQMLKLVRIVGYPDLEKFAHLL